MATTLVRYDDYDIICVIIAGVQTVLIFLAIGVWHAVLALLRGQRTVHAAAPIPKAA